MRVYFSPDKNLHESLHNILGFYPSNINLYKLAFRHSSAAQQIKKGVKDSNERLEFLGDSVIGTVVADYLFKKFPYKDEGFLTKMRSKMVSRAKHNQLAIKLGLNNFIEANNDRFGSKPSSINGDAYEALIGAIYLDKGFVFTQQFLLTRIINVLIDMEEVETKEVDFKSKFIEWAQKEKKEFRFEILQEGANSSDKQFSIQLIVNSEILGTAQHFSKKRAEQMVAEQACLTLEI
ncbi:MAG: ribonuclease III [Bacteroidetes bacterium RIFCSPLOWO2_12_FULL_35_15]|nr:MAG: ribonuclease III [Bacteroidetes bacterium RIFCSPLOWO2_12_FULL_35_15]